MLQLNFDNLFKIFRNNPSLSVSKGLLMSRAYQFDDYRQLVKSRGQGFLDLPKDILYCGIYRDDVYHNIQTGFLEGDIFIYMVLDKKKSRFLIELWSECLQGTI